MSGGYSYSRAFGVTRSVSAGVCVPPDVKQSELALIDEEFERRAQQLRNLKPGEVLMNVRGQDTKVIEVKTEGFIDGDGI